MLLKQSAGRIASCCTLVCAGWLCWEGGGSIALAGICDEVAGPSGSEGPVLLVFNEFATSSPVDEHVLVTDDAQVFNEWVARFSQRREMFGSIVIARAKDDSSSGKGDGAGKGGPVRVPMFQPALARYTGPLIVDEGWGSGSSGYIPPVTVLVTVYDEDTLEEWADEGFTPGFMNEVEVDEVPLEMAVFDMEVTAPDPDGFDRYVRLRVRKSDGAMAVVETYPVTGRSSIPAGGTRGGYPLTCPGAGRFWWYCCNTQWYSCNGIRLLPFIGPLLCGNCTGCFLECRCCWVDNPCHSCGRCGLSWILCHVFGGHC